MKEDCSKNKRRKKKTKFNCDITRLIYERCDIALNVREKGVGSAKRLHTTEKRKTLNNCYLPNMNFKNIIGREGGYW